MALYDVTNKDAWVNPRDAGNYDVLQRAISEVGQVRIDKDCRIIDAALDRLVFEGTAKNRLIFTKAGFLVGHQSVLPHVEVGHIWDTAEMTYPTWMKLGRELDHAGELQLKFVGGMVRWRISLRDETWLAYRRDSGTFNKHTGKEITISEYWVNDDYVFKAPPKKRRFTMSELSGKFNSYRSV